MAIARVTISAIQWGQTYQNVIHLTNGEGSYNATNIKDAILNYWIPAVKIQQLSSLQYQLIQVRDMGVVGGLTSNFSILVNGTGGNGTESWGPLSQLYSLHTLTGGHAGRGRVYIGGTSSVNVAQGRWISPMQDAMNTIASNLMTRFTGASPTSGFNLAVCKREVLPTVHEVVEIIAKNIPGVIRRRNIGVGI